MTRGPILAEQRADVQALLRTGFGKLASSRYWLLTISNPVQARAWIAQLRASGLVWSAEQMGQPATDRAAAEALTWRPGPKPATLPGKVSALEAVSIAFSFEGLRLLGVRESAEYPFPSAFRSGMGSALREQLLLDDGQKGWVWSDVTRPPLAPGVRREVHVLVAQFWRSGFTPLMQRPDQAGNGFDLTSLVVEGCPSYLDAAADRAYEPFGFRDGVSQPLIRGLPESETGDDQKDSSKRNELRDDHRVAPGEFLVGHRNEYGELTQCPDATGWKPADPAWGRFGLNGSYLAVRQIDQEVELFRQLANPSSCPYRPSAAEKMMGRRLGDDATPLGWRQDPLLPSKVEANAFRYRIDDANGFHCPKGAHVRRANPRDTLGHDVESGVDASKLHRLLRRGRPFRKEHAACTAKNASSAAACGHKTYRDQCGKGVFFIACNADLDRQFEFVQQSWIRNPRFGDLTNEDDPAFGRPGTTRAFSTPGLPIGTRVEGLSDYTSTIGGGYFFLPGLRALGFIATGRLG